MPRLVIVRDEATLYRLVGSDTIDWDATLILNRRDGERRGQNAEGSVERRSRDRRRLGSVLDTVERRGYAVVSPSSGGSNIDDALE